MDRRDLTDGGTPDDDVARAYDGWAERYDDDANRTRDLDATVVRGAGLPVARRDVVELGCGTGKNTAWLAGAARSLIALDFSPGMLARARVRVVAGHVRFVQHDVRDAWPLADASADLVIGNLILEHVRHLRPVYAEAARVLRPGATLFLCELHPDRQRRGGQAHFTAASGDVVHVPAYRHTVAEYINDGIGAGLRVVRVGEWLEDDASPDMPPRLLSLEFVRP